MSADLESVAARLMQALRTMPDPVTDLPAAQRVLRQRIRRVVVGRRLAVLAAAAAIGLLAVFALQHLPVADREMMPVKRLPSGLPVGTLRGDVPYHDLNGRSWPATLWLVVRADGTGTYVLYSEEPTWLVRYAGAAPGHVVLKRDAQFCRTDDNELTLDFTVNRDKVTITKAVAGKCSAWPKVANADLRNVVLHITTKHPPG